MKFFSRAAAAEPIAEAVAVGRRASFHDWARGILAASFIVAAVYTLGRFREAVAWGVILAIVFWHPTHWLRQRWHVKHVDMLAPALIVVGLALVLILPLVAIGGITLERAPSCLAAGADCAAVVSDVTANPDPEARARAWIEVIDAVSPAA